MITRNEFELVEAGRRMGKQLAVRSRGPIVLALEGELGAGKTTFVRGLAQGLGIKKRITSPTFILARRYRIPKLLRRRRIRLRRTPTNYQLQWLWHVDAYRLRDERDLASIGFDEIIEDPHAIIAIEWADRIRSAIPKNAHRIRFSHLSGNRRKVHMRMR